LLSLGSDGEFVLSLTLFKMMEALEIREIDAMIKGLQKELQGVEVSEVMVSSVPVSEVVTITEEEIVATLPKAAIDASMSKTETKTTQTESSPTASQQTETETASNEEPTEAPHTATQTREKDEHSIEPSIAKQSANTQQAETTTSPLNPQPSTLNANKFTELLSKIYDRDYDLGSCFERNITFVSFEENKLTWESTAEGEEKKMLIKHWGVINMFVKELFGFETKIVNIAKKKANRGLTSDDNASALSSAGLTPNRLTSDDLLRSDESSVGQENREQGAGSREQPIKQVPQENTAHNDADSGSMIEEIEMKSSCIAPDAGETEAAKEKDPSTLLEEPMVKTAMELFDPKKVRIKRNT